MKIWRICRRKHASKAFDGIGARRAGGRWNFQGNAVVYCSDSLALAALEALVHANVGQQPTDLVAIPAYIPDGMHTLEYEVDDMPDEWPTVDGHLTLKRLGDRWIESRESAVLVMPSVMVPQERNVLLNPGHPDFAAVKVGEPQSFSFGEWLFAT